MTMFSVPCDQASGERKRDEHGADSGGEPPFHLLGARHLANGAAEIAGIAEVDGVMVVMGARNDLLGIDLHAQGETHEDGELGARIESAHILSGVGFGIAFGLRLGEHRGVFRAFFHFAEDEVAGTVENAFDALDAIAGHALLEAGNHGNAAGDGSAVFEMAAFGRGQPLQIDAVISDEFFVGGDDAFAGFKGAAHPASGGIEAAGELDDHVYIGGEHGIGVFAPDDARGHPVDALARDAAVEDVRQFETVRFGLDENARHRTADRAKTEDGDAQMARGARPCASARQTRSRWRMRNCALQAPDLPLL